MTLDCMASVTTQLIQGLGDAASTLALAIGMTNASIVVLRRLFIDDLKERVVPSRILKRLEFRTTTRKLFFFSVGKDRRISVVVVPQGSVQTLIYFTSASGDSRGIMRNTCVVFQIS